MVGKSDQTGYDHACYPDEPDPDSVCMGVMIPFLECIQGLREKLSDRGDYGNILLHEGSKVSSFGETRT